MNDLGIYHSRKIFLNMTGLLDINVTVDSPDVSRVVSRYQFSNDSQSDVTDVYTALVCAIALENGNMYE